MKSDLATSVAVFAVGAIMAYFAGNLFLPPIKTVNIETVEASDNYTITDPDNEVFNYRAINPTVEVYIGDCTEYDIDGNCITNSGDEINTEDEEEENKDSEDEEKNKEEENENNSENPNETPETPEEKDQTLPEEPDNGTTD